MGANENRTSTHFTNAYLLSPNRPRNNNQHPSSQEAYKARRKVLGAGGLVLRKPGVMADINARRVYPIGGPQAVRLCESVVWSQFSTILPTPPVVTVGDSDDGMSPFCPLSAAVWQGGLWICHVKDQGLWTAVAAWRSVQSRGCHYLGQVKVLLPGGSHRSRLERVRRKTLTPVRSVGRTVVRAGPGPEPLMTPPSFFAIVLSPWSRVREPASDITGVESQRVGLCLCP